MLRVVFVTVILCLMPASLWAANRLGLVIGNDGYDEVPVLLKAVNDANAVSDALTQQGFEVTTVIDAPRREMNRQISAFTAQLQPGDTALVFFAGHGVEIDGENYLLPTDIVAPDSGDREFVKGEAIALSRLLDRIRATGARTTIAIIDACRENPFEASTGRSIGGTRGLGRIAAPEGTFVMFSAGAGQLALDRLSDADPEPNSVFTRALLPRLSQPGLELRDLVAQTRIEVRDMARGQNHAQFPAYYDELLGRFYFAPPTNETDQPGVAEDITAPDPTRAIREDFALARDLGDRAALEAFIERYEGTTDDITLGIAKRMLAEQGRDDPANPTEAPQDEELAALPVPPGDPAPPAPDARAIMRDTQQRLNDLGCDAGGADGVAGPRTRAAFARFTAERPDLGFSAADLGSEHVLQALRQETGRVCPAVAAAPVTPSGPNMDGRWTYRASCPLFISLTGSVTFRRVAPNTFSGPIADSLGQRGTSRITLTGSSIQGSNDWGGSTERWVGTVAADGRTYTGSSQSGCTFTATLR